MKPSPDSSLNIRVRDQTGEEVYFKIKPTTQLVKVFNAYAQRKGINVTSLHFFFDGMRVRNDQTPQDIDMEDGDQIDCANVSRMVFLVNALCKHKRQGALLSIETEQFKAVVHNYIAAEAGYRGEDRLGPDAPADDAPAEAGGALRPSGARRRGAVAARRAPEPRRRRRARPRERRAPDDAARAAAAGDEGARPATRGGAAAPEVEAEEAAAASDSDGAEPRADDAADDGGEDDAAAAFDFEASLWDVEITESAMKWLKKHRARRRGLVAAVVRRLKQLADGEWNDRNRKQLQGVEGGVLLTRPS
ncbi:hypothetical protein JL720_8677 [Aureococcus anophagefferens]|nr:hypothetical protein JL720_8677 [Aureococcus anophagefferens]